MIHYDKFTLANGLRVLFHKDETTPLAVVNILYNVGARDENENKTGFAHLFEHLMFGGSVNIPDFDMPLQEAGGESNAFTSNDITNYYDVLPAENIETALWLESDRMLSLAFTPKSLETQRSVVIEEFKQRYLNQPYGNVWLELRPLAFEQHPYKWPTIGKEIKHIEEATMEDVKSFFAKHYAPNNAILCIAGNFDLDEVRNLVEKWFADIPSREIDLRNITKEPKQTKYKEKKIESDVPADAFYYAFKMCNRTDKDYHVYDVISDILGGDKSSRLYQTIQKKHKLVNEIHAYILGSIDEGLFVISCKMAENKSFEELEDLLWQELTSIANEQIDDLELKRIKNKIQTAKEFQEQGMLNRAMNLCYFELIGDAELINHEAEHYDRISKNDIQRVCKLMFQKENCSNLKIVAKNVE